MSASKTATQASTPTLRQATIPLAILVLMLGSSVFLFGETSSAGPNQIAMLLGAAVAALIGLRNGHTWSDLEAAMGRSIATATGPLLILLMVGSLIGIWILAGVVPTMIYYGLSLLTPSIYYAGACAICAVVALATGSSWTTAGTVGLALIGIATTYDLHLGIAAGAIISGAYFGDKMSPLSDTTNLAPAVAGTDLFTHIRHMTWTTVPSFGIALLFFIVIGAITPSPVGVNELAAVMSALESNFSIGPHLLFPVVVVLGLVIRRIPALPALSIGVLVGGIFAIVFQPDAVLLYIGDTTLPRPIALLQGAWQALFAGYRIDSGNMVVDDLLSRGGMASMLTTIWLIITAMIFGAVMEATDLLETLAARILRFVRSTGSLIAATLTTSFGVNVLASDQYIAIVLPGRMFRSEYERRHLDPKNLSRTLEDSGTLTSVLVPWNICGAFMAQTLGVSTLTYAPFAVFNLINPFIAALYGFLNVSITPLPTAKIQPRDDFVS